jgi:hypothetical protein
MKFVTAYIILAVLSVSSGTLAFSSVFAPSRRSSFGNQLCSTTLAKEETSSLNDIASNEATISVPAVVALVSESKPDTSTATIATGSVSVESPTVAMMDESQIQP